MDEKALEKVKVKVKVKEKEKALEKALEKEEIADLLEESFVGAEIADFSLTKGIEKTVKTEIGVNGENGHVLGVSALLEKGPLSARVEVETDPVFLFVVLVLGQERRLWMMDDG